MEVERALRVMDGAVAVFDAVKGVEAQTMTVWRQALRHAIPTVAFVNKMDKPGATLQRSLSTMQSKLNVTPLVLQLPCGTGHNFDGVVDLVEMQTLAWGAGDEGQTMERQPLLNSHPLWDEAVEARGALIESLAAVDDNFAEHLLEADEINYLAVESGRIRAAVRNATIARKATPVLCGAAQRNLVCVVTVDYLLVSGRDTCTGGALGVSSHIYDVFGHTVGSIGLILQCSLCLRDIAGCATGDGRSCRLPAQPCRKPCRHLDFTGQRCCVGGSREFSAALCAGLQGRHLIAGLRGRPTSCPNASRQMLLWSKPTHPL